MRDLTCESPEYFNIRHTERGVLTRNTKRKGGNLHCIMAFKKEQVSDSASGLLRLELDGLDHTDGLDVALSEVEDLDSCDSDYPDYSEPQNLVADSRRNKTQDVEQANTTDREVAPVFSGGAATLSITSDSLLAASDEETTTVSMLTAIGDSLPAGSVPAISDGETTTSMSTAIGDSLPVPTGDLTPASSDGLRRSGTFTKERPTVAVEQRRMPSSDSESSLDLEGVSQELSEGEGNRADSGTGIRRSGTFTKDRPTVHVEKTRVSSSDNETSNDEVEYSSESDRVIRSRTFTRDSNTSADVTTADSSDSEDQSDPPTTSRLKRSGTFTKEGPTSDPAVIIPVVDNVDTELHADTTRVSTEWDESEDANMDFDETLRAADFADLEGSQTN